MGVFVLSFDLTSLFCMILFAIFQFFSILYLTVSFPFGKGDF